MGAAQNSWIGEWDPDNDGDDDSSPEGDTDNSHWAPDGTQLKSVPGKPMPGQPPVPRAAKPYGDVTYADPKNGKYPIDTAAHAKAAWAYISKPANAAKYPLNGVTLSEVKGRIKAACAKFGIDVSEGNSAPAGGEERTLSLPDMVTVADNGDGLTFSGYAAVYNSPTRIAGWDEDFDEQIAPGAFRAVAAGKYPVLMFEHGRHPLIGSMPLGRITGAREDATGLWIEARLTDNWLIQPVRDAVASQAIDGMSFRFTVDGDNGESWQDRAGDVPLRTLTSLSVPELGPVVFPAYEPTTASVRSSLDKIDKLPVIGRPQAGARAATGRGDSAPGDGAMSRSLSERFRRDGEALALRGIEKVKI
jgi:HK97 family phage prohead protease